RRCGFCGPRPADGEAAGRAERVRRAAAISAIDGMGGLGKTALAVHAAHHLTERYPDGQIVVEMAATSASPLSPVQGLARVIRAFEPLMQLPDTVTELRPIYLSVLRGKRVLLILDNALDGDQVAPLLPPEDWLGRPTAAVRLVRDASRSTYAAGIARDG